GVVLDSSLCPLCGLVPEDIHHVLFRCDTAKLVFRRICRLTLLKSVLGASPLYNMSIYKVPKGVLKEMEAIRCNFFNGADPAKIWVKYIPIKINVFAWRARLDRLPTRSNLVRKGVVLDSSLCPLCGLVPEDIHHVLFRCDTAKLVFRRICRWWDLDWHDLLSFSDWNAWFLLFGFRLGSS
nr:RNA-directed DNA polymerase, eukaryota [Tanacetum cinerariifolium]